MEEMIVGTQGEIKFVNKNLQKATNDMLKLGSEIRKCALATAVIIAKVDDLECYKDDGFNSVHAWTEKTFGFKKSASYTLLKIGKEYIREIISPKNGKVIGYSSNLLPVDAEKDFTTTQIEKMLPGGHDLAVDLVSSGEITPDMSCKAIGEVIKAHTKPEEDKTPEDVVELNDEPEFTPEDDGEVLLTIRAVEYSDGKRILEIDGKVYGLDKVIDVVKFLNDFCNGK